MVRSLAVLRPRHAWVSPLNASRIDDERSTRGHRVGGAHTIAVGSGSRRSGSRRTGASWERGYGSLLRASAISPPPAAMLRHEELLLADWRSALESAN